MLKSEAPKAIHDLTRHRLGCRISCAIILACRRCVHLNYELGTWFPKMILLSFNYFLHNIFALYPLQFSLWFVTSFLRDRERHIITSVSSQLIDLIDHEDFLRREVLNMFELAIELGIPQIADRLLVPEVLRRLECTKLHHRALLARLCRIEGREQEFASALDEARTSDAPDILMVLNNFTVQPFPTRLECKRNCRFEEGVRWK